MKLLVGCPVYQRAWILERWLSLLSGWADHVDLQFAFVYTPGSDDTLRLISSARTVALATEKEGTHSTLRNWGSKDRLETLASLRNTLLGLVRDVQPDLFLSLDSDILVPPWEVFSQLLEDFDTYDAVAPLVYLGKGTITNAFYQRKENIQRRRVINLYDAVMPVDVICAAKLITPAVFNDDSVSYGYHSAGEDIYWSLAAKRAGYRVALDPRVKMKHVMQQNDLDKVDERVGW